MPKINVTVDVKTSELLGKETCNICPFSTFPLNNRPSYCNVFKKELETWTPLDDMPSIKEYLRLEECKNSEV